MSFQARVILLGASNLTLAFPLIVHQLRRWLPAPLQIFAAHGHGRSYGNWAYVGYYGLPGISTCRLWDDLSAQPAVAGPTLSLLADIGNDLIYGVTPGQLLEWVDRTLDLLAPQQSRLVATRLPVESVLTLGPLRYHFIKQLLFPGRTVPWETMQQRVIEVSEQLEQRGMSRGASLFGFSPDWIGRDRIHIRLSRQLQAWRRLFDAWDICSGDPLEPSHVHDRWRLWRANPREYRTWCWTREGQQPCRRWEDGSELWLY